MFPYTLPVPVTTPAWVGLRPTAMVAVPVARRVLLPNIRLSDAVISTLDVTLITNTLEFASSTDATCAVGTLVTVIVPPRLNNSLSLTRGRVLDGVQLPGTVTSEEMAPFQTYVT